MAISKGWIILSVGENIEELKPSYIANENVK
jgi:hypothetical protein